jgi:solute carrier family 25 (mitochondrial citrate transporter), member 1
MSGIIPKMAIRFTSYEWYKQMLADKDGMVSSKATFAGMSRQTLPAE